MDIKHSNIVFPQSFAFREKTNYIILHHAAATSCTVEDIHGWHLAKGWNGIGYHFFVRKDGSIYDGRPINAVGAHTYGKNSVSVGVCFEGNLESEVMTETQRNAGLWLVNWLLEKYPAADIKKHSDFNATACPGQNFPFADFKNLVSDNGGSPVLRFQKAAVRDGFSFPKYGCDGQYGRETDSVARRAVVRRYNGKYLLPNLTSLVQQIVGVTVDGKCGPKTEEAIRKYQIKHELTVDGQFGRQCWASFFVKEG